MSTLTEVDVARALLSMLRSLVVEIPDTTGGVAEVTSARLLAELGITRHQGVALDLTDGSRWLIFVQLHP